MLAGISVDYVVRLEQARGPQPSEQVLTALCRALRLETDERDHVFHLAGTPPPHAGLIDLHVRPSVLRLIDRFHDLPALVISAKGDVLAWNAMSSALHGDWSRAPAGTAQPAPAALPARPDRPAPEQGRRYAARSAPPRPPRPWPTSASVAGRYPDDPGLARLLEELHAGSAEFRELWASTDAGGWRSHTKTVTHPTLGRADAGVRHPARPGRGPEPPRLLGGPRLARGRGAGPAPRGRHPGPQHGPLSSPQPAQRGRGGRPALRLGASHRVAEGEQRRRPGQGPPGDEPGGVDVLAGVRRRARQSLGWQERRRTGRAGGPHAGLRGHAEVGQQQVRAGRRRGAGGWTASRRRGPRPCAWTAARASRSWPSRRAHDVGRLRAARPRAGRAPSRRGPAPSRSARRRPRPPSPAGRARAGARSGAPAPGRTAAAPRGRRRAAPWRRRADGCAGRAPGARRRARRGRSPRAARSVRRREADDEALRGT